MRPCKPKSILVAATPYRRTSHATLKHCNVTLQHTATHCNTLTIVHRTATDCNRLQHASTHCAVCHKPRRSSKPERMLTQEFEAHEIFNKIILSNCVVHQLQRETLCRRLQCLHTSTHTCVRMYTCTYVQVHTRTHTHMTRGLRVCSTECGLVLIKIENTPWHNCRCIGLLLQQIAAHCNTLQHVATRCNTLQHVATRCNTLQHVATRCNTYPKLCDTIAAAHDFSCNKLCCTLQHVATLATSCNTLQHCNTYPKLHDTICHCNWLLLHQSAAQRQHIALTATHSPVSATPKSENLSCKSQF